MSVLIYTESDQGKFKKIAFELASYGKEVANQLGTTLTAITINADDASVLGDYGVDKVLKVNNSSLDSFNAKLYADVIKQAAEKENAKVVVVSSSINSKYLSSILSVSLDAGLVSNVVDVPLELSPFTVKRTSFTNKAIEHCQINSEVKIIALSTNSFGLKENSASAVVEDFSPSIAESGLSVQSTDKSSDKVTIADAEIVVSAGRGLKGPENWGIIEELANVLGAATACSKPVSDLGWRPHSEHVGQTGKPVACSLYFAIGISGAIQHLAGVSASKVKVVINTDSEAPFFKAADYGIVGDAFEVVPALTQKLKDFKLQNA